jgi:hypothetical protein
MRPVHMQIHHAKGNYELVVNTLRIPSTYMLSNGSYVKEVSYPLGP